MAAKPTKRELALYSLPPEDFVAARNELAKELRKEGRRDQAERVRKLAKPTVPAWAVNRAAGDDPDAAGELLASGDRLAKAQRGAGAKGGGARLRDAMGEHGAAIESLMGAVAGVLREAGHAGSANLDRARDTLRAVATDDALRVEFEQRRIASDREPVGFGSAPEPARSPGRTPRKADRRRGAGRESGDRERERARTAQKQHAAAEKRLERARNKLQRAERAARAARQRLEAADAARGQAAREVEAAEAAEDEARGALG